MAAGTSSLRGTPPGPPGLERAPGRLVPAAEHTALPDPDPAPGAARRRPLLRTDRRTLAVAAGLAVALFALSWYRHATFRSSTLDQRLDCTALPAELADLAGTFNDMLDRLEESFRRLERFSADIAHELRTPVNNLRGEVEVALGQPRSLDQYRREPVGVQARGWRVVAGEEIRPGFVWGGVAVYGECELLSGDG